jgi:hypothetical protein
MIPFLLDFDTFLFQLLPRFRALFEGLPQIKKVLVGDEPEIADRFHRI